MGLRADKLAELDKMEQLCKQNKIDVILELSDIDKNEVYKYLCEMDGYIIEGKYWKARKARIKIEDIRTKYRKTYTSLRIKYRPFSKEDTIELESLKKQINRAQMDGDSEISDSLSFKIKIIKNKYIIK